MTTLLALDFGGTKLAAGVARDDTGPLRVLRTASPPTADAGLSAMLGLAERLLPYGSPVDAVGVSFGGHVDPTDGTIRRSLQVPGWDGVPLGALLRERFGAPVRVVNDGAAGAVGEWWCGAGASMAKGTLLYLTVSTGVGGGVLLDGRLHEGANGMAGEFGHLPAGGAAVCTCGRRGCLEAVASGPAIARAYDPTGAVDAERVAAAARHGDARAAAVLSAAGASVGDVIATLACVLDPDVVAVGGGVAGSGARFWTALHENADSGMLPGARPRIVPAALADAPLVGACLLAAHLDG
ncbi:MAG TPA: ROK family protein [Streptosporangiales bacterium]